MERRLRFRSTPPIGASDLYANASRDRSSGKLDLALQEFNDYLKYYGNTDLAPNAQFYVGMIHYSQSDFETAAQDFDMVLEKYSKNPKTEDALYYKGMSLLRMPGHKTQAGDEFKELIKEFPNTDRAKEACTQLTTLGYNTCRFPAGAPPSAAKRSKLPPMQPEPPSPPVAYEQVAGMIDHALLGPALTSAEVIEGLELARRCEGGFGDRATVRYRSGGACARRLAGQAGLGGGISARLPEHGRQAL